MKKFLKIFAILFGFAFLMTFTSCIMATKSVIGHNVTIKNDLNTEVEIYYYPGVMWEDTSLTHEKIPEGEKTSININLYKSAYVFYLKDNNGELDTMCIFLSEGPYVPFIKLSKMESSRMGGANFDRESHVREYND